jgi:hypothetical protein
MSFYDPFKGDDHIATMNRFMLIVIIVVLLLFSFRCRADELSTTPSMVQQQIWSSQSVLIAERIHMGIDGNAAATSVLKRCGWLTPEVVMDVMKQKMPVPKNMFELSTNIGVIVYIACMDPSVVT